MNRHKTLVKVLADSGLSLPFTDDFANSKSYWSGTGFATGSGVATISPTLGAELLVDGALENWTSATNLTSWNEGIAGTSTVNREGTTIHGGTYAARLDVDASGSNADISQAAVGSGATGKWYLLSSWLRSSASGKKLGFTANTNGSMNPAFDPGTTYTQCAITLRSAQAAQTVGVRRSAGASASSSLYADDLSFKELTLSTMLATVQANKADVTESAKVTRTAGCQAGLVLRLDSTSSPANFIIVYLDGIGNVKTDECVNGTYANIAGASGAVTYVAGAVLQAAISGNNITVTYNGSTVGAQSAVTANTNTRHGLMSTYSANSFDDFSLT